MYIHGLLYMQYAAKQITVTLTTLQSFSVSRHANCIYVMPYYISIVNNSHLFELSCLVAFLLTISKKTCHENCILIVTKLFF